MVEIAGDLCVCVYVCVCGWVCVCVCVGCVCVCILQRDALNHGRNSPICPHQCHWSCWQQSGDGNGDGDDDGVTFVRHWCCICVTVVVEWCYICVPVVTQWSSNHTWYKNAFSTPLPLQGQGTKEGQKVCVMVMAMA
jgi:hypothetical protein